MGIGRRRGGLRLHWPGARGRRDRPAVAATAAMAGSNESGRIDRRWRPRLRWLGAARAAGSTGDGGGHGCACREQRERRDRPAMAAATAAMAGSSESGGIDRR
ncbi:hypothetical protein N007_17660 [Alicyclobacillus acidoterrestris ATCC 49025]|nr:hypothetical protein N007_17660 [Alicyclobacillus acidoterrestris ATCC 49025]